ncbi:exodeoxyribonuclease VII large subunit [Candidatus Solincola sp.]|nr:exodeoxyribonuclease VII large subunit [Actinomycetota bacterium]MDI7251915.1 exodeoxyribonuclease VII large subunit [Actinomycetota bacterium]
MKTQDEERVYTVGEVNRLADGLLQEVVLWVEGEVSNLRPYPQYLFFSLSEEEAVLPCVMFGEAAKEASSILREGMRALARGRLGIYVRRGQYRMNVQQVQEAGEGRLRREFFRLMRKLSAEGLFDERLKRPLPPYPESIGLITSLEGAAVRDVIINLTRRYPCCRVLVRGVRVQGEEAVGDIVSAIGVFNRSCPVDVLILARGGGSLEDLQPFNTEEVVRAIRNSSIPVVTGVGHEPDLTLADLAADHRASTPTGAAEAAVPSSAEVLTLLRERGTSLEAALRRMLHRRERDLSLLASRRSLRDGEVVLGEARQRLAEGETLLLNNMRGALRRKGEGVEEHARVLVRFPREYHDLPRRIGDAYAKLRASFDFWWRWREREPGVLSGELKSRMSGLLSGKANGLELAASRLDALSPLAVLSRGYAIATRRGETRPLKDSLEVAEGEEVDVRLHRGRLFCEVRGREEAAD